MSVNKRPILRRAPYTTFVLASSPSLTHHVNYYLEILAASRQAPYKCILISLVLSFHPTMTNVSRLKLLSALLTLPVLATSQIQGSATFTGNEHTGGTCSLTDYSLPDGVYGTGIGPSNWASGGKCGSCLQVTGPLGTATVMVKCKP